MPHSALLIALALSAALTACDSRAQTITERAQSDTIQDVSEDDPAMLVAFVEARHTLDAFLARLKARDPAIADPILKVKIEDGGAVEYFWVASPRIASEPYSGVITNEPERVHNVKRGQVISFPKSQIYDWSYQDSKTGKMVGNFTACALLTHETPESAAEFRRTFHLDCADNH